MARRIKEDSKKVRLRTAKNTKKKKNEKATLYLLHKKRHKLCINSNKNTK